MQGGFSISVLEIEDRPGIPLKYIANGAPIGHILPQLIGEKRRSLLRIHVLVPVEVSRKNYRFGCVIILWEMLLPAGWTMGCFVLLLHIYYGHRRNRTVSARSRLDLSCSNSFQSFVKLISFCYNTFKKGYYFVLFIEETCSLDEITVEQKFVRQSGLGPRFRGWLC